jgi:hypothetical protein
MDAQTHITDYIPAQVLEREGYIHRSDMKSLLEAVGPDYVNVSALRGVKVSLREAAEIVKISVNTLTAYAKMGYIVVEGGKVLLLDALNFDFKAAKADYHKNKQQ